MMKKPLLVSLAAAALLTGANVNAASMFDRMTQMETEMKALQAELDTVKAQKAAEAEAAVAEEEAVIADEETDAAEEEADEDAVESDDEDEEDAESELEEQLTELNKRTSGNHLKFGVDLRTSVDNLQYKMADGSKQDNSALFTNRLWLNMNWAATEHLSFTGQLAYNKAYGARSGFNGNYPGFETFDWITNENPYDDVVRVRSAYFFYRNDTFLGTDIPWTFSIGRRPSTNGHLANLREDDVASSPMGHTINVEFDGASAKFSVWEDVGMYFKICAGRGGSNANAKFFSVNPITGSTAVAAPYATNDSDIPDIDLAGLIFVPYDDGQYSIGTQYYYAKNLIDAKFGAPVGMNPNPTFQGMEAVGGMHSFTGNVVINGIGDEWSDFLDDTTFFVSGAVSITDPDKGKQMLGYNDSIRGWSGWVGLQFPSLISEEGRWGVEYNYGTQNWRSITYGEDTLAGSKLATRGSAYEAYFTEPLIGDIFSFQLRYTYIDYKWAGSNGFFGGATGTPTLISDLTPQTGSTVTVDTAQDIRAYLRYRF
jgi:hypothetical protein